jgi:hypothetical protein
MLGSTKSGKPATNLRGDASAAHLQRSKTLDEKNMVGPAKAFLMIAITRYKRAGVLKPFDLL